MKKNKLWLGIAISTFFTNASAVDLTAEIATGYDDNPFRLADSFDPDGGWFLDTEVKMQHDVDKLRLRGKLFNRAYEDRVDDGDYFKANLDARYKTRYELAGKKATSHVMIDYEYKDKTYVQRSTGQIGTFSGNEIDDRYDYDSVGLEAKTTVSLTKALNVGLQLDFMTKDYEDYDIPGLSNLDYDQVGLKNDWIYKFDKQSKMKLELFAANRDFDDKREKTKLGKKIAGTNLDYDYLGFAVAYYRDITDNLDARLKYFYEERRDSGPGYYDTDNTIVSAKLRYKVDNSLKAIGIITYQDKDYINSSAFDFDEDDDGEPSKEGYTVQLSLEKEITSSESMPVNLIAGIRYDDYDSNDPNYEYDRSQVFVGINIGFGQ